MNSHHHVNYIYLYISHHPRNYRNTTLYYCILSFSTSFKDRLTCIQLFASNFVFSVLLLTRPETNLHKHCFCLLTYCKLIPDLHYVLICSPELATVGEVSLECVENCEGRTKRSRQVSFRTGSIDMQTWWRPRWCHLALHRCTKRQASTARLPQEEILCEAHQHTLNSVISTPIMSLTLEYPKSLENGCSLFKSHSLLSLFSS